MVTLQNAIVHLSFLNLKRKGSHIKWEKLYFCSLPFPSPGIFKVFLNDVEHEYVSHS